MSSFSSAVIMLIHYDVSDVERVKVHICSAQIGKRIIIHFCHHFVCHFHLQEKQHFTQQQCFILNNLIRAFICD